MKLLAGNEPPGEGERRCLPRLRVELVGQESRITPGLTVLEQVLEGCGAKRDLLVRFSALSDAIAADPSNEALMAGRTHQRSGCSDPQRSRRLP